MKQTTELADLRRSSHDRKLAGVAGGIARHLDLDPTLVRVLFVVLAFFGGAGVFAYVAAWLVMPKDDGSAAIGMRDDARAITLVGIGAVGLLIALSWGAAWSLVPLAIVALVAFLVIDARQDHPTGERPMITDDSSDPGTTHVSAPTRTGPVLLWPTLAIATVAVGVLGLYDIDHDVAAGAYPALVLAIIGVGTVIGAFVGRAGGLVMAGIVTGIVMLVATAAGDGFGEDEDVEYAPATAAALASDYHLDVGELRIDLTDIDDPGTLDGRRIEASVHVGKLEIIVPDELNIAVDADNAIGEIRLPDRSNRGGFGQDASTLLVGSAGTAGPTLTLDADVRVGQITIDRR